MAKKEVVEYCSECENEVVLQWDTDADGFEIVCPYCGKKLMLCDECKHTVCEDGEPHDCDWCDETSCCHRCKSEIAKEEKRLREDHERRMLRKKAHERYKMWWMTMHEISIADISDMVSEYIGEIGGGAEDAQSFANYLNEHGFAGGSIWPCYEEFLSGEYRDSGLMEILLSKAEYVRYRELEGKEIKRIVVTDIQWDAPESANLPSEITIDITPENQHLLEDINGYAENLSDYLSDTFEYCHAGFSAFCE